MNPEIKEQWVAALRSGEYQQGYGVLHRKVDGNDMYCCLGILCEVARQSGLNLRIQSHEGNSVVSYDGYDDFLPASVKDWAGLESPNPGTQVPVEGLVNMATLSYLNDNGKNFSDIADIIERDL